MRRGGRRREGRGGDAVERAMRVIVYGLGAIGGTVAAALALAGREVVGIARGAQLKAIREAGGLRLRTAEGARLARFDCVGDPAEIGIGPDDADPADDEDAGHRGGAGAAAGGGGRGAADLLHAERGRQRADGAQAVPERARGDGDDAGRPSSRPARSWPRGRRATASSMSGAIRPGSDADDEALAAALQAANIAAFVTPEVMASKYGKLLLNLHNIVEAALGPGHRDQADRRAAARRGRGGAGGGGDRLARGRGRRSAARRR